jgi:dephospho-CoA kinase
VRGVSWFRSQARQPDPHERVSKCMSETDHISFEKIVEDEKREWDNADPSKQNPKAVSAMADVVLTNDATQEDLFAQVEKALENTF